MITLEGNNLKILSVDYDKWCIEVVDLDSNILFNGTYAFDVIREREKPIKVVLYYYTAKPVDKPIEEVVKENEQLKKEIENVKDINTRCSNEYSYFKKRMMKLEKENEQLKQKISELKCLLELAKLHTEVAEGKMDKFVELKLND